MNLHAALKIGTTHPRPRMTVPFDHVTTQALRAAATTPGGGG
jgi:urease accessory protein UreE